jgi:HEAT repeat protein
MTDDLMRWIAALGGNPDERQQAQARLRTAGPAAVEPLIAVLQSDDSRPAWSAAQVLGDLGDARALPALIAAIRSPNALLGSAAAKAALKLPDPLALSQVIAALPAAPLMTQQSIVLALQQLGDSRAVEKLVELLAATSPPIMRTAIIKALGDLGDAALLPVIRPYLDDADHHVRDWAAEVVQRFERQV